MKSGGALHRRINVTLPEETIRLLEASCPKGDRSRLIDRALRIYLERQELAELRRQLEEGYRRNRKVSRVIAEEWRPIEEEVWLREHR